MFKDATFDVYGESVATPPSPPPVPPGRSVAIPEEPVCVCLLYDFTSACLSDRWTNPYDVSQKCPKTQVAEKKNESVVSK